jgi:tetratricopeptide (TPR) repeat protein
MKYNARLLFFLLLFSVLAIPGYGQSSGWELIMEMVVTNDGKKMQGAEIKVYRNGSLVETIMTDDKGRADVPMKPDGNYEIAVSGNGLIKKTIAVNTSNVPPEDMSGPTYFPAEVDIFPKVEGLDLHVLNEPIGKIAYDPSIQGFDADLKYTKERQAALQKLTDDYHAELAKEAANEKQIQKDYDDAIKRADKAFSSEDWETAEKEYKRAAALKPIETYPSFQLAELQTKLIKIREINAKYDEAIKKADAAAAAKDYQIAIAEYKKASGYKPDEAYPQDKVNELQGLLANQAKVEQEYLTAIEKGDNALKINDLQLAKEAFQEASTVKPAESYPKNKLAEINDILGKQEAKQAEYQAAIKAGDEALAAKNYDAAKASYQKALGVKPTESYPQEQIVKVEGLIAQAAELDKNYKASITKGDQALAAKSFEEAKSAYQEANKLKPAETYPQEKLKEISDLLAQAEAREKAYADKIKTADEALKNNQMEEARIAYQEAAELKPTETYPKQKIQEIKDLLAAAEAKEQQYKDAIAKGDKALADGQYDEAKAAFSQALTLKPDEEYPKEKLGVIETIVLNMQQKRQEYEQAIKDGDAALADKNYDKARDFYAIAQDAQPEESYPKEKLKEIEGLLAAQQKAEQDYLAAIEKGDNAFKAKDFDQAKNEYNKALALKPEEKYPQEQLGKIENQLAAAEKLQADFEAAVKKGDAALSAQNYTEAQAAFKEAQLIKADDPYPQEQLDIIAGLLEEQETLEKNYQAAVKQADGAFEKEEWEPARLAYNEAASLKPQESYPKERIEAIKTKLEQIAAEKAAAQKLQADYLAAVEKGDLKFTEKQYQEAITAYEQASKLKPEETYPSERIAEAKEIIKQLAAEEAEKQRLAEQQKQYEEKIKSADAAFKSENLENARKLYQEALAIKAEETYPQQKIDEINTVLADAAEQDQLYLTTIESADELLAAKEYEAAKKKYAEASSIKSAEEYPKSKITEIEGILAQMAAEQEEIRLKQQKEAELDARYQTLISEGDGLSNQRQWEDAIAKYEEALTIKDEQLPKDKIAATRKKMEQHAAEVAAKLAAEEEAEIEAAYQAAIAKGEELIKVEMWEGAIKAFETALTFKEDPYPREKISDIEKRMAEIASAEDAKAKAAELAKKEAKYLALIAEADQQRDLKKYTEAKSKYQEALAIQEKDYPKQQIALIDEHLAAQATKEAEAEDQAEKEAKYKEAIAKGDQQLALEDYQSALSSYQTAASLKPSETYPPEKIQEVESILARIKAENNDKEARYAEWIKQGDNALGLKQYQEAKNSYKQALTIKPNDTYAQAKIAEIEQNLFNQAAREEEIRLKQQREAKNEAAYQTAVAEGDKLLQEENYTEAENKYELALGLKPSESYPAQQIQKINQLRDEKQATLADAEKRRKEMADRKARYEEIIQLGDEAFANKTYNLAKREYEAAVAMKFEDPYPKQQIEKINEILAGKALAKEEALKKADEPIKVQTGPKSTIDGSAEAEIDKMYQEMWAKQNEKKTEYVEEQREQQRSVSDQQREEDLKKQQNALERIEGIAISMREQNEAAKELHMQNYESVQLKEEELKTATQELQRAAERRRNDHIIDEIEIWKDIDEENRKINQQRMEGKKEMVENEFAEVIRTAEYRTQKQRSRIEERDDNHEKQATALQGFHQERAADNQTKNTDYIDKTTENWSNTLEAYNAGQKNRREAQQQKVFEKQEDIRQFRSENKTNANDNYLRVKEKAEALQEETASLNAASEKRRQENADREFYQGEKQLREDTESSKYPQGVSENIIESGENSTTIQRIVVEGTQTDVYEKTLYSWGGVFYTKNGHNITKEQWDAESK